MASRDGSIGSDNFVERHGLWSDEDSEAASRAASLIEQHDIEIVRFSIADQHGILRGKSLIADGFSLAMRNGCTVATTLFAKDTSHRTVYPVFSPGGGFGIPDMGGGADLIMVPDPKTFHVLPWAPRTGWMLCDVYFMDGRPVPFSTRQLCRNVLDELEGRGYGFVAGIELEFYVFRLEDAKLRPEEATQPPVPPDVSLLARGYQYQTELRLDQLDPAIEIIRRDLLAMGMPLRSIESEFGPSQVEISFYPGDGLEIADSAILFRSAVKQICRRHGYHATFMCRPAIPNVFASGWHMHQSLVDRNTGRNAFTPRNGEAFLSPLGMAYMAGLLKHAWAASVFTTPTINGYKRYHHANSLAPIAANWGRDNRGVMVRAIGGADDPAARLENRIGDPAANPYLYVISQIVAGMDGVENGLEPPSPTDLPYQSEAPPLPRSLMEAVPALREDKLFRGALGDQFVDYILTLKEAEIARFLSEVTDWEQREYFEIF